MSKQRRRSTPGGSQKAVPVARVVALPGSQSGRPRKRKRFPWAAMTAISATALLFAGILWLANRTDAPIDPRVADTEPGPVLAPAEALADSGDASAAAIARTEQSAADGSVVAPADRIADAQSREAAVDNPFDGGALDVSLLQALEPERITEAARFAEDAGRVRTLVMSPDGSLLASGGFDGAIRLWNVESRQPLRQLDGHTGTVQCLEFSADGARLLSGGADRTVRLWDVATGSETQQLTGHRSAVGGVAFALDGEAIYSADAEGGLKKWELATGKAVQSLDGGAGFAKLAISHAGDAILAGGWDGSVHVWDGSSPGWTHPAESADAAGGPFRKHAAAIAYLHVDAEGTVVSADEAGEVAIWNLSTGEDLGRFATGGSVLGHVASASGGVVLTADGDGTVQVWDPETESVTHKLVGHEARVAALAVAAAGESAISAGSDGTLRLWTLPAIGE